jgi:uncharacterized membrane protein YczE
MDQIGTSHITLIDLIICGAAIALYFRLTTMPPNTVICRIIAVLCGCIVVGIVVVLLLADNLGKDGVMELSMIAFWLCIGLSQWDHARVKSKLVPVTTPSEFSK